MKTLYNTEPNDIPTLLIVEDDRSVAEGLSDILTGYQYQVFHTERTADTMDFLEHQILTLSFWMFIWTEKMAMNFAKKSVNYGIFLFYI